MKASTVSQLISMHIKKFNFFIFFYKERNGKKIIPRHSFFNLQEMNKIVLLRFIYVL
jgi:hypothetical protein